MTAVRTASVARTVFTTVATVAAAVAVLATTTVARADAPPVPTTVSFSARVLDDKTGDALAGAHHLKFELFDAATAGHSVWFEGQDLSIDDGLVFAEVGKTKALDATVFTGPQLFLEVSLDDAVMSPRIALDSVPYAIKAAKATDSESVGGLTPDKLQQRVTGTCGTGNFIIGINADGTVACAPDLSGSGDITDVLAGNGLAGGGTSGSVTVSLAPCGAGQILKSNGTAYACAADDTGTGDITGVIAGPGLTGGGLAGDVTLSLPLSCAFGQVLKWNGSTWACANDIDTDTNSGGDITSVNIAVGGGLTGGGTAGDVTVGLLASCAPGQVLKWSGAAWACANDIDTDTNSGGDITDVIAGAGLVGGGSTGSVTVNIGSGPGISVGNDNIQLDTGYTDGRYVLKAGDTMGGDLNMANHAVTNRACNAGYVRIGPGLCTENVDASGFTLATCANRCRVAGTHVCSGFEMRAIEESGVALGVNTLLDWIDDQDADDNSLYVNQAATPENLEGSRASSTSSYCRCCQNVE